MAFGVGDVCTRANGRGEPGWRCGCTEETGQRPSSLLSALPAALSLRADGKAAADHTRGLRGRIRQMARTDYEKGAEDRVGGCFHVAHRQQQQACAGKLAKMKR